MSIQPTEYDLDVQVREGYIFARIHAVEMERDLAHDSLQEIRKVVAEKRAGYLLLEPEFAHAMSESDVQDLVTETTAIFPGMRLAFVTADTRNLHRLVLTVELGLAAAEDYAVFRDADSAAKWLLRP
jgi:hypothetical protein